MLIQRAIETISECDSTEEPGDAEMDQSPDCQVWAEDSQKTPATLERTWIY